MLRYTLHTFLWCAIWILGGYLIQPLSAQAPVPTLAGENPALAYKMHPMAEKIAPSLLYLADWYEQQSIAPSASFALPTSLQDHPFIVGHEVYIEAIATADGQALAEELTKLGLRSSSDYKRVVGGKLPISQIMATYSLSNLQYLHFQSPARVHTGIYTTQGDIAIRADIARTTYGLSGTGVKVGVISDSYNALGGANAGISTGELPGVGNATYSTPVDVVAEIPATPSTFTTPTDEGRAMLEIIHDVAPGATLAFHTADGGRQAMALAIQNLRTAGCDIILDDVGYFISPVFQDGIIAQEVDKTRAAGVSYLSSAGNYGLDSYNATFSGSSTPITVLGYTYAEAHEFAPGDIFQEITIPKGENANVILQWSAPAASAGPINGPTTDYDLYLLDSALTGILAASFNANSNSNPVEFFQGGYTNNTSNTKFNILIVRDPFASAIGLEMQMILSSSGGAQFEEYQTQSSSIFGQSNAKGAISIGASAFVFTPPYGTASPLLNTFSSQGGGTITYDTTGFPLTVPETRQTPDVVAADGGVTSFFPTVGGNFFGTSASVAHAAGVVALMKDYSPTLTPDAAELALENTALDIVQDDAGGVFNFATGYDSRSGFGLIQADDAIDQILPVTLQSFLAEAHEQTIRLSWETSQEINNEGFEIDLRPEGSNAFATQRFVPSFGEEGGTYRIQLPAVSPGTYEVRLGQRDLDGVITYSAIQSLRIFAPNSPPQLTLDQGTLTLLNPNEFASYHLAVYDLSGKMLWETDQLIGSQSLPVALSSQFLLYKLTTSSAEQGNQTYTGKWVVE